MSPSCAAQECGMTMLRMEPTVLAGFSLCASIFHLQRLLFLAQLWSSEKCLLPSQVMPPSVQCWQQEQPG